MPKELKSVFAYPQTQEAIIKELLPSLIFPEESQARIIDKARDLITIIRDDNEFVIEEFMQQFNLATEEGVAIMALAEALLRIPDNYTAGQFALLKLANKNWQNYLGKSKSLKANITSLGLYVSGKFAEICNINNVAVKLLARVGQPIFLLIITRAIAFLSKEFIFGFNVNDALKNARNNPDYRLAFDLLGESARTDKQAESYYNGYVQAITQIVTFFPPSEGQDLYKRPNLSVKLTALYPRFELAKITDIENIFLPKLVALVKKIKDANLTITFDAEEANRLDIYLLILTKLIKDPEFKDFEGIGLVVQAYQIRGHRLVDYIIELAKETGKKIPIRLVKGAYWDSEIKYAQENALEYYPVFTKKEYTDCSYIACARKMLENDQYIFPQFATHNALTAATIIELAGSKEFEFQKLHGMGKRLHEELLRNHNVRIYAPVGKMSNLLAYLIRRMLENGANGCFVNQVNNPDIDLEKLAYNLHERIANDVIPAKDDRQNYLQLPKYIYPNRDNAMGYDLGYKANYDHILEKVSSFYNKIYEVGSIINGREIISNKHFVEHFCPAKLAEKIASVTQASEGEIYQAIEGGESAFDKWSHLPVTDRANILRKIAEVFEENKFELYALLIKEGGKTIHDAINEVIEAIDFCRYYANQAEFHMLPKAMPSPTGESNILTMHARGTFLCISPWNFPLAIFTGQIIAALVCGNTVLAKPADQTPIIANFATKLMHQAGVPPSVLQLIIARGSIVGTCAVPDKRIAGVVFTGSNATAKIINTTLAARDSIVPFIAETGGQNAMIVDSSALLEQVTDDVLASAFYSAGQRCSALRMLYIQEEIFESALEMIKEAMELVKVGDNSDFATDIGPVINQQSQEVLGAHIDDMTAKGFALVSSHPQKGLLQDGYFFYPHILKVNSISDIPDEKFGPILHVASYKAEDLDKVIDQINNCGFGLTFGLHTRLENRIEYVRSRIKVGNMYVNRSIVGAKVESQPFGGENKSGTGFKAGGPHYLLKFLTERTTTVNLTAIGGNVELLKE